MLNVLHRRAALLVLVVLTFANTQVTFSIPIGYMAAESQWLKPTEKTLQTLMISSTSGVRQKADGLKHFRKKQASKISAQN